MKKYVLISVLCLAFASVHAQGPMVIDLEEQVANKNIDVYNREMTTLNEESRFGIRLSKDIGEGIAWLKGIDFSQGTIEFDVRGENIKAHSFVGLAFHGTNNYTFDAIYLRPFQFQEQDPVLRSHSIQYISLPEFTWRKLRASSPGKYENVIDPSPDPSSWVHMRIVVKDKLVSVYVNGGDKPSLVVEKVTATTSGKVGFYVADTSGGDFANLVVTKK